MAQIRPTLNLKTRIMSVSSPDSSTQLDIPLDIDITSALENGTLIIQDEAHATSVDIMYSLVFISPHIRDFFSTTIGVECSLAMYCRLDDTGNMRHYKSYRPENKTSIMESGATQLSSLSYYSLILRSSVDSLSQAKSRKEVISRGVFRPNFVLEGDFAHSEEFVRQLRIGDAEFDVRQRKQCHMVWVDLENCVNEESRETFMSL